jgi:hypothetical protein
MKSWSARALSVRRVTQDNQGKKTAGVDGIKSLTPKQRLELTGNLKLGSKVSKAESLGKTPPPNKRWKMDCQKILEIHKRQQLGIRNNQEGRSNRIVTD